MNNKAQVSVGWLILVAVVIIIGLVLLNPIASNIDTGTRANSGVLKIANQTVTLTNGTITELTGQELISGSVTVTNRTNPELIINANNYSLIESDLTTDGLKGIIIKNTPQADIEVVGKTVNVSYSYYPDGYIDDAGARSIAGIIILLVAIGIAIFVLIWFVIFIT